MLEGVYDVFVQRLIAATGTLTLGDPADPDTDVGPVIDDEGRGENPAGYIEIGKSRRQRRGSSRVWLAPGRVAPVPTPELASSAGSSAGQAGHPARTSSPTSAPSTGWRRRKSSGPVLSVMKARDFDEALAIANGLSYKLTGGVFSRSPANLEKARREFRVGNLYLNRADHRRARRPGSPSAGLGLSGGGTKAGGREYLLHFVQPRALHRKHPPRTGFAPAAGRCGEAMNPGRDSAQRTRRAQRKKREEVFSNQNSSEIKNFFTPCPPCPLC